MKNLIVLYVTFSLLCISCDKESKNSDNLTAPFACVYKIRDTTYFNYVKAYLDKSGQQIGGHIGPNHEFHCSPLQIDNFYYYESNYRVTCEFAIEGSKTIILDINNNSYQAFNTDTMMNHILDKNPFIEYYEVGYYFIKGCKSLSEDTAQLNKWIRNGELEKHLTRVK